MCSRACCLRWQPGGDNATAAIRTSDASHLTTGGGNRDAGRNRDAADLFSAAILFSTGILLLGGTWFVGRHIAETVLVARATCPWAAGPRGFRRKAELIERSDLST